MDRPACGFRVHIPEPHPPGVTWGRPWRAHPVGQLLRAYGWRESWHQSRGYLSSDTSLPDLPRRIPKPSVNQAACAARSKKVLFPGTSTRHRPGQNSAAPTKTQKDPHTGTGRRTVPARRQRCPESFLNPRLRNQPRDCLPVPAPRQGGMSCAPLPAPSICRTWVQASLVRS